MDCYHLLSCQPENSILLLMNQFEFFGPHHRSYFTNCSFLRSHPLSLYYDTERLPEQHIRTSL
uniref:Uncharacterized protein n=1 Tax=Rhizophagus irregularis (strain DAOM 181602 / DAOM 197198 / MUCL 43194) TaxID=747089 RepID=U9TMS4_RHIID